mmetsp:Transcript_4065/g.9603  ORF Transcript_4065/g.9603 Transcript_4065/m.9603 type:complete len:389 (+) Transcript_4065:58-1224(+)
MWLVASSSRHGRQRAELLLSCSGSGRRCRDAARAATDVASAALRHRGGPPVGGHRWAGLRFFSEAASQPVPTAGGAPSGGSTGAGSEKKQEPPSSVGNASDSAEAKKPRGWAHFWMCAAGGVAGITFLYYFYKANYSLHQTEILMLAAFRRLPLYWPPGPSEAERHSKLDPEGLPLELFNIFAEWFVLTDVQQAEGVTRDDVLELMQELGFSEEDKPCKQFLQRGESDIEEQRRLSNAGLQESISLLAKLAFPEAGGESKLGPDAADVIRRKFAAMAPVSAGASALQLAMQAPPGRPEAPRDEGGGSGGGSGGAGGGPGAPPVAVSSDSDDVDGLMDEQLERQLEANRLGRMEAELLAKLERLGCLSPGEEARLNDVRERKNRAASAW